MRIASYGWSFILGAALAAPAHAGTVILVPQQAPSIGAAIAEAEPGDTVIVSDGVYTGPDNRDLSFGGKDLVVRSANGPIGCIIDCEMQGRAFIFDDGETAHAVLEGFTIRNGVAPMGNGGGIDIALGTSPTIRDCIVRDCMAAALGGGMAVRGECTPIIDRCVFIDNLSFGTVESSEGGGLCLFFLCPATVSNCVFVGNYSEYGGGLSCALSDATIANCLFVENTAAIGGGAIASDVSHPLIVNCTMADNLAAYGGAVAGISSILESHVTLANSILWGNAPDEIVVLNGEANVRYSNVKGGWMGPGNIDASPVFIGDTFAGSLPPFALASGSPCIDAGDNTAVPAGVVSDLEGQVRHVDDPQTPDTGVGTPPLVDMGAYEHQAAACIADLDADGSVAGSDLGMLLGAWGPCDACPEDLNADGTVDGADLGALLAGWGACPP